MVTIPPLSFSLPERRNLTRKVLSASGYPDDSAVPNPVRKEAQKAVDALLACLEPESIARTTPVVRSDAHRIVGDGLVIASIRLARLLAALHEPAEICGFAVTLGPSVDRLIREHTQDSITRAFFTDSAGSLLVEAFAAQMETCIRQQYAKQELSCTARCSPGYCDWETGAGQDAMFTFLAPESIGIQKLASGMMTPEKSITAIMLSASAVRDATPCRFCDEKACPHRRHPRESVRSYGPILP